MVYDRTKPGLDDFKQLIEEDNFLAELLQKHISMFL